MEPLGIYIHVPFCNQLCPYCDFYSKITSEQEKDSYVKAVLSALENHPFGKQKADTLYFGGGTPTTLGAERLVTIATKAREVFSIDDSAEITLEANPESTTKELLELLRQAGFNRISFGVQSSNAKELETLGRLHTAEEAKQAILLAEQAGFPHISADLMMNIPHQTRESLTESIEFLAELPLDHISAYMLIIEEGTPFARQHIEKLCPTEEEDVENYLFAVQYLAEKGYSQYEISNFAKAGGESRHNLKYWDSKPYLGIGPSAHSFMEGERFAFPASLPAYLASMGDWSHIRQDGAGGDWEEYAMLRLRLVPGLSLTALQRRYPQVDVTVLEQRAQTLQKQGYITLEHQVITFTPEGFLLSDAFTADLLFG